MVAGLRLLDLGLLIAIAFLFFQNRGLDTDVSKRLLDMSNRLEDRVDSAVFKNRIMSYKLRTMRDSRFVKYSSPHDASKEMVNETNSVFSTLGIETHKKRTPLQNHPFEKFSLLNTDGYIFKWSDSSVPEKLEK